MYYREPIDTIPRCNFGFSSQNSFPRSHIRYLLTSRSATHFIQGQSGLQAAGHFNAHTFFPTPKPHCGEEHRLRFPSVLPLKKEFVRGPANVFVHVARKKQKQSTCTLMPSQMCKAFLKPTLRPTPPPLAMQ